MARILIIDDDELFCRVLTNVAEPEGNEILCAHTLGEGLRLAASENIDVVFLDVMLPDGNGLDQLGQIHDAASQPEVIIITGGGTVDGAELAIESDAWDYISKPCPINVMRLHLMRALQYRAEKGKVQPRPDLKIEGIIGSSAKIKRCHALLAEAAAADINVLLTGETGTGKELFAKAIHANSRRAEKNFIVIDCSVLQDSLKESILFGYVKGAFTGADKDHEGLIKQADRGTLFLDEVGELPLSAQKNFLRVIQEHRFRPLGSSQEVECHFRLIAATNRDLDSMVQAGQFRADLLYRIRAQAIALPPLRERIEDIAEIAAYHVMDICGRSGIEVKELSPDFSDALLSYRWPGNVRELVNALESAVAAAMSSKTLFRKHLSSEVRVNLAQQAFDAPQHFSDNSKVMPPAHRPSLKELRESTYAEVEKRYLQELIKETAGDIAQACLISKLGQARFYGLLRKHRISTKL